MRGPIYQVSDGFLGFCSDGGRSRQSYSLANDVRDPRKEYKPRNQGPKSSARARLSIPPSCGRSTRAARHCSSAISGCRAGSWLLLASTRGMPLRDDAGHEARFLVGEIPEERRARRPSRACLAGPRLEGRDAMGMRHQTVRLRSAGAIDRMASVGCGGVSCLMSWSGRGSLDRVCSCYTELLHTVLTSLARH